MKRIIIFALAGGIFWLTPVLAGTQAEGIVADIQEDGAALNELAVYMVKKGIICAAIGGHKWEDGCGKAGCLVWHGRPMRHCLICGKSEAAKVEWE